MPGGGGNPLVQAVSYQMKHYHPGMSRKAGKAERHLARLSGDAVSGLQRRSYHFKARALKVQWLLCESAEALKDDARGKIEAFLSFVERTLGKPGGVPAVLLSLKGFSGGSSAGVFSIMNHGPPASTDGSRILPRLISRLVISGRKLLCAGLAGFMACLGLATSASSAPEQTTPSLRPTAALIETQLPGQRKELSDILLKQRKLHLCQINTSEFDTYFNTAVQYAQEYDKDKNPETRQKAVEAFKKAIALDQKGTIDRMNEMDKSQPELYKDVRSEYLAAVFETNQEKEKEKKKGFNPFSLGNLAWEIPTLAGIFLAADYFSDGKIDFNFKKEEEPPPGPKDVTITLDAYNHTEGFQKDLTARTVREGSAVAISIADTGVTGIDTKYIAVYSEDFKTKIAFDSDAEANFTAPSTNVKYHVIMFNALGTNPHGDQVSYDWISGSKLYNGKRNHTVYRQDFDGQTMEERVWGGADLPEIGGKRGVFDQLNDKLKTSYNITWGSIDRQPTATTGDFSYGAGDSNGADGYHYGSKITVNAKKLDYGMKQMVATGLAEAFENLLNVNNIGGRPSSATMQSQGVANENCKRLLLFAYIKDNASFSASSSGVAAVNAAFNMINVNQRFGPVEIGLNSGALHAGFKNNNLGFMTNLRRNGEGLENYTTANLNFGKNLQAGFGMLLGPNQQAYTANSTLTIDKVIFGVSGGYDANSRIGNVAANIGAKIGDGNVMLGVAGTPGMFGFNVQATQSLRDIGIIGFRGIYTKNQLADFTTLGLDARLDNTPIGPINIIGDYLKSGAYKRASLGIGKQLGPGVLSFSIGTDQKLDARYTASIGF